MTDYVLEGSARFCVGSCHKHTYVMKLMEVRGKYEKGPPAVEEKSEAKFIRRRGTLKRRRRTLKLRRGTLKRRRSFNFSDKHKISLNLLERGEKIIVPFPESNKVFPVFSINNKFLHSVSLHSRKDFVILHPKRIN